MPRDENMIAALKRERAGYVARGMDDRVAEVDEQLKHYGHDPATDDDGAPKGRRAPEGTKQTADAQSGGAEGPEATGQDATKQPATKQTAAQKRAGGKD